MSDPEKLREEAAKLANSGGGFFSKLFGGNKVYIGRVMESLIKNGSQRQLVTLLVLLGYEPAYAYANFYD